MKLDILWRFGLLSSSLLLYSQRFGRYVLRPSSEVYTGSRTKPFVWITGVNCSNSIYHDRVHVWSYSKDFLSLWNHVEVSGSIPATGKNNKKYLRGISVLPARYDDDDWSKRCEEIWSPNILNDSDDDDDDDIRVGMIVSVRVCSVANM